MTTEAQEVKVVDPTPSQRLRANDPAWKSAILGLENRVDTRMAAIDTRMGGIEGAVEKVLRVLEALTPAAPAPVAVPAVQVPAGQTPVSALNAELSEMFAKVETIDLEKAQGLFEAADQILIGCQAKAASVAYKAFKAKCEALYRIELFAALASFVEANGTAEVSIVTDPIEKRLVGALPSPTALVPVASMNQKSPGLFRRMFGRR